MRILLYTLWILSNDFRHLTLGAGSGVFDGSPLGSVTLAGFSGAMVFRLTKRQTEDTGKRRHQHLLQKY